MGSLRITQSHMAGDFVVSVFLAIISWFLCTVFYDNSTYRKRWFVHMVYLKQRENLFTSNLVRHNLNLVEEKRTILSTCVSIGQEFTLISRMTNIHSQWNSQPEPKRIPPLGPSFQIPQSNVLRSILVRCDF